jgi:probable phosphoglycerate mutase
MSVVLLSHLFNVSPMILWHSLAMAPTSVTTVYSEERRSGIASFRASAIGDISHLLNAGREPSFSARFCEVFGNGDRQD